MKVTVLSMLIIACSIDVTRSVNFVSSAFVSPASPTISSTISSSIPTEVKDIRNCFVASGYRVNDNCLNKLSSSLQRQQQALFAKKKKKSSSAPKSGKIQVKLLKFVEGTGSVGDVIMVAPAFFEHKLKKTGSAVRISDEDVAKERAEADADHKALVDSANDLQEKICDMELSIGKKAGPDGTLFGGVGKKAILSELKTHFPKGTLDAKAIKIISLKGEDEKEMKGDIKNLGKYTAIIALMKDITAKFDISIVES